jgi:hypothetical protein
MLKMANVIQLFYEDKHYGYCANCGSMKFKLEVSGDDPEDAMVIALECDECEESISLAPITVECEMNNGTPI